MALTPFLQSGAPAQEQRNFLKQATIQPVGRAFHCMVVLLDLVYVFGGSVTNTSTKTSPSQRRVNFFPTKPRARTSLQNARLPCISHAAGGELEA